MCWLFGWLGGWFGWWSCPAAGDHKGLQLVCSLGCSRHASLQSDEDVTGEMSHQESFEGKGGPMVLLLRVV